MDKQTVQAIESVVMNRRDGVNPLDGFTMFTQDFEVYSQVRHQEMVQIIREIDLAIFEHVDIKTYEKIVESVMKEIKENV